MSYLSTRLFLVVALCLTALVGSCTAATQSSSQVASKGKPQPPKPAFTVSLSTRSVVLIPGGSAPITVTISPATVNVQLKVGANARSLPSGVTVDPFMSKKGKGSIVFRANAKASQTTRGPVAVTLTFTSPASGRGGKPTTVMVPITLKVVKPTLKLSVDSPTVSVVIGDAATVTVTAERIGFSGAVALSLPRLPQGVTASPAKAAIKARDSSLTFTINTANTAVEGTVPITVKGASGKLSATTKFNLELITPAPEPEPETSPSPEPEPQLPPSI